MRHRQIPLQGRRLRIASLGARGHGATAHVVDGLFIHRHQTGPGAGFDGHVADRHATFHAQCAHRRTAEFDGVAGAAGGPDLADDGQHHVLGGAAARQHAVHAHQHILGFLCQQRLGGQHMFDFAGADAVRQRAKGAVGGGVRVTAHHGHARQRGAVFRSDDVHDALAPGQEREVGGSAKLLHVAVQRRHLLLAGGVGDAVIAALPAGGWRVVVRRGDDGTDAPDLALGDPQTFVGLRASDFVH